MSKPLVAYYRVSTREQGRSGLGIDAQRAAVARFAEVEGFEIVAEHVEIETGKGRTRSIAARNSPPPSPRPAAMEGRARSPSRSWIGFRATCISSAA